MPLSIPPHPTAGSKRINNVLLFSHNQASLGIISARHHATVLRLLNIPMVAHENRNEKLFQNIAAAQREAPCLIPSALHFTSTIPDSEIVERVAELKGRMGASAQRLAASAGPVVAVASRLAALVGMQDVLAQYVHGSWIPHILATQARSSVATSFERDLLKAASNKASSSPDVCVLLASGFFKRNNQFWVSVSALHAALNVYVGAAGQFSTDDVQELYEAGILEKGSRDLQRCRIFQEGSWRKTRHHFYVLNVGHLTAVVKAAVLAAWQQVCGLHTTTVVCLLLALVRIVCAEYFTASACAGCVLSRIPHPLVLEGWCRCHWGMMLGLFASSMCN
jgi:hypothetical protein